MAEETTQSTQQPSPIPSGGASVPANSTPANVTSNANATITSTLDGIQKSLNSIYKILKNGIVFQRKLLDRQTRDSQADQRKVRERITESGKSNGIRSKDIKQLLKSFTPIDFIKNFIYYTVLGFVTTKLLKFYPQLLGLLKLITPIVSVFEGIVGGLFNIFVIVIDRTYTVFDRIRGLTKIIGGQNFQNAFDKFSSTMNTFFNVLILTGIAVAGALMSPDIRNAISLKKGKPTKSPGEPEPSGGTPKPGAPSGTPSPKIEEPTLPKAKPKFKPPSMGEIKTVAKDTLKIAKSKAFLGGNAIMGIIELIVKVQSGEESLDKAIVTTAGSTLGTAIGELAGGFIGGVLGSFLPGIGNVVLGFIGSAAGAMLGGYLGEMLGNALYSGIKSWMGQKEEPTTSHASGGIVPTRGGQIVRRDPVRTIKKMPKTLRRIPNKKVVPGRDIGGKKEIEKILRNPSDPKYKNPLRMLMKNSDIMGRRAMRGGFVMEIMKLGQDMATLGQKPDRQQIDLISDNFSIFISNMIKDQTSKNIAKTTQSVFAMADGGYVPTTRSLDFGDPIGDQFKKLFKSLLMKSVNTVSAEIFRNIKKELGLLDEQGGPGGGPGGGDGGIPSISMQDFSEEDIDALGRMIYAESSGESDLGKAAVLAVILNRWRLIKSGQVVPGTFSVSGVTKDSITLKDILFAKDQFMPVTDGSFAATTSQQGKDALGKAIKANGNDPQQLYKNLIAQNYSPADAEYIVRATFFATTVNGRFMRPVKLGGHYFQQASNAQFRGKMQDIPTMQANVTYDQGPLAILPNGGAAYGISPESSSGRPAYGLADLTGHTHSRSISKWDPSGKTINRDFSLVDKNGRTDVPVVSPVSGKVVISDWMDGYGWMVRIKPSNSSDGPLVLLAHLKSKSRLKENSPVIQFQTVIGIQGSTGRSDGPHVHMEAYPHVIDRFIKMYRSLANKTPPIQPQQNIASINPSTSLIQSAMPIMIGGQQDSQVAQAQMQPISQGIAPMNPIYSDDLYNTNNQTQVAILPMIITQQPTLV